MLNHWLQPWCVFQKPHSQHVHGVYRNPIDLLQRHLFPHVFFFPIINGLFCNRLTAVIGWSKQIIKVIKPPINISCCKTKSMYDWALWSQRAYLEERIPPISWPICYNLICTNNCCGRPGYTLFLEAQIWVVLCMKLYSCNLFYIVDLHSCPK